MSKVLLGLILALSFAQYMPTAIAADTTSKKAKSKKKKNVDKEITNARMRQASGSKKKWSFSGTFNYNGGSLTNPLGGERINLSDPTGDSGTTSASQSLGIRYRLNPNSSLSLGLGLAFYVPLHPFHGSIDEFGDRADIYKLKNIVISSPSLSWSYFGKFFGKQQSFSVGVDVPTNTRGKSYGYVGGFNLDHSIIFKPSKKTSAGFYTGFGYGYSKKCGENECQDADGDNVSAQRALSQQGDMSFSVIPFFEYAITPKYSFRTVFNWFAFQKRNEQVQAATCNDVDNPDARGDDCTNFSEGEYAESTTWGASPTKTQSVGLGIAYSRDVYIYPNFQFNIEEIKPSLSNVAVSVSFSL